MKILEKIKENINNFSSQQILPAEERGKIEEAINSTKEEINNSINSLKNKINEEEIKNILENDSQ